MYSFNCPRKAELKKVMKMREIYIYPVSENEKKEKKEVGS